MDKVNQTVLSQVEFLQAVLTELPGNIYWKDRNGVYLGCNENQARVIGLSSSAEVCGKTDYDFYDKEVADLLTQTDNRVMRSNSTRCLEEIGLNFQQQPVIYLTTKKPICNQAGEVVGILGVSQDITEKRDEQLSAIEAREYLEQLALVQKKKLASIRSCMFQLKTSITKLLNSTQNIFSSSKKSSINKNEISSYLSKIEKQVLTQVEAVTRISSDENG
jgi:two-component system aerobic respiration control sensor histidine kinase ArcB